MKRSPDHARAWFLLAWTAPDRQAAQRYFSHLQKLDPDNQLVKDGLDWSQKAWSPVSPTALNDPIPVSHVISRSEEGYLKANTSIRTPTRLTERREASPLWGLPLTLYLGLYLIGIALAEWVTAYMHPQLGLVVHGLLLVLIFLHASLGASQGGQRFLFALALAPLIRLLSLSMPLVDFPFVYWYAIIGGPLFLAAFLVLRLSGFRLSEIGMVAGSLPQQILIGLSGFGLGWVEYQILRPEPLVSSWRLEEVWLPALILLVFTGFLEELIFRGMLQRAAAEALPGFGLLYISLLFAVLHIGYQSFTDFAFVLGVGLAFALVVRRTGSIWGVTLAHGLTNIALFLIFPLI